MGTHLRVHSESFPMNTNMTGFRGFSKIFFVLVLWSKVASALEGSSQVTTVVCIQYTFENNQNKALIYSCWMASNPHFPSFALGIPEFSEAIQA